MRKSNGKSIFRGLYLLLASGVRVERVGGFCSHGVLGFVHRVNVVSAFAQRN